VPSGTSLAGHSPDAASGFIGKGVVMENVVSSRPTPRRNEKLARDRVTDALRQRFPALTPEAISDLVRRAYLRYEHARIRDYAPVLVERELTQALRATHGA
jgi:hypothetical protein